MAVTSEICIGNTALILKVILNFNSVFTSQCEGDKEKYGHER